jgi:hypothetical protein
LSEEQELPIPRRSSHQQITAGRIAIHTGDVDRLHEFEGLGYGAGWTGTRYLEGLDEFSVSVEGAGIVPAFDGVAGHPAPEIVVDDAGYPSPSAGAASVPRAPFALTWDPAASGETDVVVRLHGRASPDTQERTVWCRFPASRGNGTVPLEYIEVLAENGWVAVEGVAERVEEYSQSGFTLQVVARRVLELEGDRHFQFFIDIGEP